MNLNPAPGLSPDDVKVLEQLRTRLTPLVYNIEQLQMEMARYQDAPPSWPVIHRQTKLLNSHLTSLHNFLNSSFNRDNPDLGTNTEVLAKLVAYPQPPFPSYEKGGLIDSLVRKKPEIQQEKWIEERLVKAAEFCAIPEEQGVEIPLRKTDDSTEKQEGDNDSGGFKRTKTNMDEDDMESVWKTADEIVTAYNGQFEMALKRTEITEENTPDSLPHERTPDDYLQAVREIREKIGMEVDTPASTPESTTSGEVPRTEQPAVPLGMMLKFMSTGNIDLPASVNP